MKIECFDDDGSRKQRFAKKNKTLAISKPLKLCKQSTWEKAMFFLLKMSFYNKHVR